MLGLILEQAPGYYVRLVRTDRDFASLRGEPRFQAMMVKAEVRLAAANSADGTSR